MIIWLLPETWYRLKILAMIFVPLKKLARICRNLTGMIKALCWTNPVVNHPLPRCLKAGKAVSGLKCGLPNRCVISIPEDGYPRLPERVVRNTALFLVFVWKSSITPLRSEEHTSELQSLMR